MHFLTPISLSNIRLLHTSYKHTLPYECDVKPRIRINPKVSRRYRFWGLFPNFFVCMFVCMYVTKRGPETSRNLSLTSLNFFLTSRNFQLFWHHLMTTHKWVYYVQFSGFWVKPVTMQKSSKRCLTSRAARSSKNVRRVFMFRGYIIMIKCTACQCLGIRCFSPRVVSRPK